MASHANSIPPPAPLKVAGEAADDWERFKCEFENYEIATDLVDCDEKKRAAVFLACIGSAAHAIFRTFKFETDGDRAKIEKIKEQFDKHWLGEVNVTYERYVFHQRIQQPGESVEDFVADLRKLAKSCAFEQLEDSLIRDRLVVGIRDDPTRRRLLQVKNLSLTDAINACKVTEATNRRLRTMNGTAAAEVDALTAATSASRRRGRRSSRSRDRTSQRDTANSVRRCPFCDRQHGGPKESCPAFGQQCRKCGKKNHFQKVCRSTMTTVRPEVCEITREELLTLQNGDKDRAYCNLRVNHHTVCFLLDCGATVNLLTLKDATAISPKLRTLRPPESRLTMFDGTELKTLGMLTAVVEHPLTQTRRQMDFYVAAQHERAVLGMRACQEMELLTVNADNICAIEAAVTTAVSPPSTHTQHPSSSTSYDSRRTSTTTTLPSPLTKDAVIKQYGDLFKGVGLLEGDVHLEVDPSVPPVQMPPRRLPVTIRDQVKDELDRLCREDIIEPVTEPSPWISALMVAVKPNSKLRLCVDTRPLNKALKRQHYPTMTIDDVLPQLAKAKVYSTIDCASGFHHLRLDKRSSALTTFTTPFGRFRWKRMCFGISPAPEIWQAKMNEVFSGLRNVVCIADDVLCFGVGDTYEEAVADHDRCMIALLNRCREKNLRLNKEKLQINRESTTYMGHELTKDGVKPDRRKIAAILDMPPPVDRPALRRLLGMATYLARYVPKFSDVTAKLRELLSDDVEFRFDDVIHGRALQEMKELLVNAPVLRYYDVTKPVHIQCDSSSYGIGATLIQDGQPVEYASRSLTRVERDSYAQIEREMAAIVFAVTRFHTYIYGKQDVTIATDHRPLVSIHKKSLTSAPRRLQRMLLQLQKYTFQLVYIPGTQLVVADTLSRACLPDQTAEPADEEIAALTDAEQLDVLKMVASPATIELIKSAAASDEQYQLLRRQIDVGWHDASSVPPAIKEFMTFADELTEVDELVFKGDRVVVPQDARGEILRRLHSLHIGMNGCIRRARESVFYPGLTADIKRMVSACAICAEYQATTQKEPLLPYAAPSRPWERVGVDIFTLRGQDYLLTTCYLSGYFEVDRLASKSAKEVIYCLKSQFARHGLPTEVVSDNVPFKSAEFRQFAQHYDFKHVTSSPHYPQSNGKAESSVKTCKRLMEKAIEDREDPHLALLAWRNTPSEQLGPSPVQVMFGRRTRTHLPMTQKMLASAHDTAAHDALQKAKERQSAYYNDKAKERQSFKVGDTVRTRWNKDQSWDKAEVTKVLPYRSYDLRFEDGSVRRRTARHVRFSPEPPIVIRDEIDAAEPPQRRPAATHPRHRRASPPPTALPLQPTSSRPEQPRSTHSGRLIKRPAKLNDYVCN